jgi:PmbA protein
MSSPGNLRDMFLATATANDLEIRMAVNAPTLRIEGMTIAGR